jgi:ATP-binding cassette subfamily F protein uup
LQQRLAQPDLFARDRAAFDRISQDLAEADRQLAAMEEEWLELELLREEIEG